MTRYDMGTFKNIDSEPFRGRYAGEKYPQEKHEAIQPGQEVVYPKFLVEHFAKHLVDRILAREDKLNDDTNREDLMKECMPGKTVDGSGPPEDSLTEGQRIQSQVEADQEEMIKREQKVLKATEDKRLENIAKIPEVPADPEQDAKDAAQPFKKKPTKKQTTRKTTKKRTTKKKK